MHTFVYKVETDLNYSYACIYKHIYKMPVWKVCIGQPRSSRRAI